MFAATKSGGQPPPPPGATCLLCMCRKSGTSHFVCVRDTGKTLIPSALYDRRNSSAVCMLCVIWEKM